MSKKWAGPMHFHEEQSVCVVGGGAIQYQLVVGLVGVGLLSWSDRPLQ